MKLDVRCKFLLLLLISAVTFAVKDIYWGSLVFLLTMILTFLMGQIRLTLKYALIYGALIAVVKVSPVLPKVLYSLLLMLILCLRMFMPVVLYAGVFWRTTRVSEMVTAMYALHIPKGFTITFAVAMRFFPSAKEEMHYIGDAMKLRGLELSWRNLLTRPVQMLEGMMVPLIMRAATIAEELSASAISRGLDNPGKRSAFFRMRITFWDILVTVIAAALYGAVMYQKIAAG